MVRERKRREKTYPAPVGEVSPWPDGREPPETREHTIDSLPGRGYHDPRRPCGLPHARVRTVRPEDENHGANQLQEPTTMNKQELVDSVYDEGDGEFESRAAAERAVAAVFDAIKSGLKKDASVQLIGFGTFEVKKRKARTGRHPRTGEPIKIKASKSVGFRPGKALKDSI
jgi:DNA-binding protein HU-beta